MTGTALLVCDAAPLESITLDVALLREAAAGWHRWIEPLWPALMERARTPRRARGPWPAVACRTVEEQYLVGLALDCAAWARVEVVRTVIARHVVMLLRTPQDGPTTVQPDVDTRLRLVAAAAAADARLTANEKVN